MNKKYPKRSWEREAIIPQYVKDKEAKKAKRVSDNRYYTTRWRRMRKAHLSKYPLCVKCKALGITTEAYLVDHIIPINKKNNGAMFDSRNYQSMCLSCHSIKTMQEQKGVTTPKRKNEHGYYIPKI